MNGIGTNLRGVFKRAGRTEEHTVVRSVAYRVAWRSKKQSCRATGFDNAPSAVLFADGLSEDCEDIEVWETVERPLPYERARVIGTSVERERAITDVNESATHRTLVAERGEPT